MPPRRKAAAPGGRKAAKSAATPQKKSDAAARGVGNSKGQPKRQSYSDMLISPFESEEGTVIIGGNSKRPIELKAPTPLAARKRRRATLSMAEIFAESSKKEEAPKDHAAEFVAGSTALYTWGAPASQAVPAVRNERRHKGLRGFGVRRGKDSAFVRFMFGSDADGSSNDTVAFRFLDLPLEIRWKIYGCLLIHPKPILMHPNWQRVHVTSPQDHTILRVSKQILLESTQFLYEKNIFQAVINPVEASRGATLNSTDRFIKYEFLPYLRNVIVDCRFVSFVGRPKANVVQSIATCLSKLIESEALLDSLTLIVSPVMKLTNPTTALGLQYPIFGQPIPDYFKIATSEVMQIIPKLRCKVLNIIIAMPDRKRVLVSLNLRDLSANQDKTGWFAEEVVAKLTARELANQVKMDLIGLEKRFEDILENTEQAIMEGKARLMEEDETFADGMRLASRR